jgi:hypothetical protein
MKSKPLCAALAACGVLGANSVTLNPDGQGQALIYPYYTVRSSHDGAFNTYISVVNNTPRAKAVRVRAREARLGKAVVDFNLYLSPNDTWTATIVPTAQGARLISTDTSCTDPPLRDLQFHDRNYAGANDGAGEGLDRTREGYIEMLEMATLSGASANAITHTSAGVPSNCAVVISPAQVLADAPTGGLSGTLTLIDVLRGMDFTVNAEALDGLASRPYYRPASDPYPDLSAREIDPVSVVIDNGWVYRASWSNAEDAVNAVLLRFAVVEYVLDASTRSMTEFVITMPTWHLAARNPGLVAPFSRPARWAPACQPRNRIGELLGYTFFNREEATLSSFSCNFADGPSCPRESPSLCAATATTGILSSHSALRAYAGEKSPVLGSKVDAVGGAPWPVSNFLNGFITVTPGPSAFLTSLEGSTRTHVLSGEIQRGPQRYVGLPIVGFMVRTFQNGTLDCAGTTCQGNFGGAFGFRYARSIDP